MFVKLLKHDFRSNWGILGLLSLIIISSGAAMGGSGAYLAWNNQRQLRINPLLETALSLLMLAAGFAVAICCAGAVFCLIWRFYQSRFTDEGYLTFSLPVTTHQILLSSLVNILLGCVVIFLAVLVSGLVAAFLLTVQYAGQIDWADLGELLTSLSCSFSCFLDECRQDILLGLGVLLSIGISRVILMMLAVTIGSVLAKKHKLIAAVGVYWLITLIHNITYLVGLMNTSGSGWAFRYPFYTGIGIAFAGYFLMYWLVDKKLNLN